MFMFSIFCFIFAEYIKNKTRKTMIRLLITFILYGAAVVGITAQ